MTDAGKGMLVFGLYHPKMDIPPLGKQVAEGYTKKTKNDPNRLIFQAADCLLVIADAVKRAGSTDPEPLTAALRETKLTGTRGTITFSQDKGYTFQQWVDIPHLTFQITQVKQKLDDTTIVQQPGQPLDTSKIVQP